MKYKIVYDKPGRIRFRCGQFAFDKELEHAVKMYALSLDNVTDADAHYENGSILVCYKDGHRDNIVKSITQLDTRKLVPIERDEIESIDQDFKRNITKVLVTRFVRKAIFPAFLGKIIVTYRGLKYIWHAIDTLGSGKLNVDVLDGASVAACLLQRKFSTAGTIMFMLSISSMLEEYTRAKTKAALTESLAIKTDKVWLVSGDTEVLVPMSQVMIGDVIKVRTGHMIPVDGEVVSGEANVNESSLTGEPISVMRSKGASVFAGTVVEEGAINIKIRSIGENTKIQKIIELIDNSENLKAGIQSKAENIADRIVPFSFIGFGLTLLLTRNVTKAVSILMVDYSCALKLSTPISVISALREASNMDITVKGGKYLEEFAVADSIVFDKTGTLTNAEPALEKIITFYGCSEEEILQTAACIEEHFPHSVAKAIVKAAEDRGIMHEEKHADVEYIVAHGIATQLYGKRAVIGSKHFIVDDEHVEVTDEQQAEIDKNSNACSVVYLAIGGELIGALCINDPPRDEAKDAIDRLKNAGFEDIVMLTGDSKNAAEITAEKLGIPTCYSSVLPEEKHGYIEKMKADGKRVIMVGDGINDAPALASANVSAAMSDASDIAKEAADITLRGADLTALADLRELSVKLMERIHSNYRFIVGFNSLLLILGFTGMLTPTLSAFLHNASTMGICAKSMLPLLKDKEKDK